MIQRYYFDFRNHAKINPDPEFFKFLQSTHMVTTLTLDLQEPDYKSSSTLSSTSTTPASGKPTLPTTTATDFDQMLWSQLLNDNGRALWDKINLTGAIEFGKAGALRQVCDKCIINEHPRWRFCGEQKFIELTTVCQAETDGLLNGPSSINTYAKLYTVLFKDKTPLAIEAFKTKPQSEEEFKKLEILINNTEDTNLGWTKT